MSVTSISPTEAHELLNQDNAAILIDVRTPAEFRAAHASCATLLPLDQLAQKSEEMLKKHQSVFVICKSGARATQGCEHLSKLGYSNVKIVEGGTDNWIKCNLPVERASGGVISIERQVRIGAGVLILLFGLLSLFVHPFFVLGCLFVGAGLTFAGITDWCGMGLLLAKMPWNR